ncbi:MAG: 3-dehydro-L-gulonate 2-dehydrogenase [Bacteroidetes bacterium]|nr:MAG: 3-dehydro-L-gulonate 2-dehydrogenase [Bacteroidota bacterium]
MRIPYQQMKQEFERVLKKFGFSPADAELCARLFAGASLDGVYSHGLNRFPLFIKYIRQGWVKVGAKPERLHAFGPLEQWHGHLGPGNLNAYHSMQRAMELAATHGIGCVALGHTNHWMRAGSYGWQAAEQGFVGICWTNTIPNMPAWGGTRPRLGNNPLVVGIPRQGGHIVLDMAMSQFSYGKLNALKLAGEQLPVVGGYDQAGQLTTDPAAILESWRPLPIGFWKGAGLSLVLDVLAALLSGGKAAWQIGEKPIEYALSQVFIAIDPTKLATDWQASVEGVIQNLVEEEGEGVFYPGQRSLRTRTENLEKGIPVEKQYWEQVQQM